MVLKELNWIVDRNMKWNAGHSYVSAKGEEVRARAMKRLKYCGLYCKQRLPRREHWSHDDHQNWLWISCFELLTCDGKLLNLEMYFTGILLDGKHCFWFCIRHLGLCLLVLDCFLLSKHCWWLPCFHSSQLWKGNNTYNKVFVTQMFQVVCMFFYILIMKTKTEFFYCSQFFSDMN
jgi:hypothetical protein